MIVGAGHGGAQAAGALRLAKFEGSIALLGDEVELPYERPPLSKDYLSGAKPFERLLIHPDTFWSDRDISILSGRRVIAVDPVSHQVRCEDGGEIEYGHLVWAAGGSPRTMACSGHDLVGVHTVRTRADADRIRAELGTTSRVVVIGGGYIGLEAAAVLAQSGKAVTVLEAQNRVLARVAGEPLSRFYEREHQAHGVEIRLGVTVECIEECNSRVSGVRLSDGEVLACDMVIVGIGIVPAVEPLLSAGAEGTGGVEVDGQCRTSLPDVFAIGDCASHLNRYAGETLVRLESVQNAHDQATVVAKVLTGNEANYDVVPWFWSNQYDLRLQTVGLSTGYDETVVRGDPGTRRFSIVYLRKGQVIALDCVNATRDYVQGKRLVTDGLSVNPALLADTTVALKTLR
ncbi:NAD(P)/FAD-dependent oxidoreductase [Amycolatopsis sp. H20-H5]|uniref:NAD(P)/FAD-dependent oxidoreductase n=1 Tax=Amycolatopsis sp. H20-H5 TaxID=3046309 RepID=UPI002DBDB5F1|nr:FAD-dependent oxidoreductase [Amycolatopsis sp. H20-H5]MEC3974455.1 FAD-dependent oxidoreductase [Amycolatopsis sp. H20-H5]